MLIAIICLFTGFFLGFFTAEAQRHVDNPTGRITWTIGCLNPKHFHTHGYMNAAIAEIQLGKLLRQ